MRRHLPSVYRAHQISAVAACVSSVLLLMCVVLRVGVNKAAMPTTKRQVQQQEARDVRYMRGATVEAIKQAVATQYGTDVTTDDLTNAAKLPQVIDRTKEYTVLRMRTAAMKADGSYILVTIVSSGVVDNVFLIEQGEAVP